MGKYPLVSLFILLGFFLGWGPSAEGESFCEAGNRTRVLHITFYEGDACQTMRQLVAAYPNAQVIIDCPPFNQWRVSMWNDFYLGKNGTYELAILDSQLLAQGVIQGHLKELTGFLHHRSELLDDFYPSIFASYSEFPLGSKRFYGIPIIGDVQVLAYRKSIFHTIAQDDIDSLSTLLQVARQISTTPALNISGYTTAWCANFAECYDAAATTWNQIAWSFGGELWDHNTYQVRGVLDQPLNELALNFSQELVQYGPPGSLSFTSRDAMHSICNGQVAMAAIWGRHAYDIVSPTCTFADDILFTVFPGASHHSLSLSGQGIHVNDHVSSERQSAAMCFLDWILATEQQKEFVRLGGISPRKSILSTGFFINRAPFHGIFVVSYPLVKDFWNLPEYSQLLEIQMSYLQLALNGTLTSAKALSQTARQQQEIINDSYPNGPPPPNLQLAKISLGALLSILIVAGIFMIIIAGLAVWIWVFRDEPIIRYSSPIFMLFILLGLALLLSSLFTYLDSPIDTAACRLHLWLSVLGTFLALAPILAKTWRITVIWIRATQLKSRVIPNRTVLSVLAVLMVLPVTVLSVWTPFYETQTLYYEPEIDSYLVRCSKHYLEIFLTILVVYLGLLGCSAACMAFLTRNVYTEFNESRYLAIIIYNSTLLGAVFLPLIFFLSEDPTIIFLLEAGAILSWSALILLGLFGPKLYTQIAGLDDLDRSQSFHPTPPSQFRNSQSPSSSPLHLTPLPFP